MDIFVSIIAQTQIRILWLLLRVSALYPLTGASCVPSNSPGMVATILNCMKACCMCAQSPDKEVQYVVSALIYHLK